MPGELGAGEDEEASEFQVARVKLSEWQVEVKVKTLS